MAEEQHRENGPGVPNEHSGSLIVAGHRSRPDPRNIFRASSGAIRAAWHTEPRVRLRRAGSRVRPRRPEGGHSRGQARAPRGGGRAPGHDRRRLHQHRHHPVQDAARGGPVPDRPGPAGDVRAELPGQGRDHHRRPAGAHAARDQPGDRGDPQPALPQPDRAAARHRLVRRRRTPSRSTTAPARQTAVTADKIVIATGTARPGRPPSSSTTRRSSTPTASCDLERVPQQHDRGRRRASSASSTPRCSPRSAARSRWSSARPRMLEFCDVEIVEALKYHLRDLAVTFRFGETVAAVRAPRRAARSTTWRAGRRSRPRW